MPASPFAMANEHGYTFLEEGFSKLNEYAANACASVDDPAIDGAFVFEPLKDGLHHAITPHGVALVEIGGAALGAGIEVFAQHGVGAMQARFHHSIADAKTLCGFRHTHFFLFTQHDH